MKIAKAKAMHRARDEATGLSSHSGRLASRAAFAAGLISEQTRHSDELINRAGNLARHSYSLEPPAAAGPAAPPCWADPDDLPEHWGELCADTDLASDTLPPALGGASPDGALRLEDAPPLARD
eukprot:CAMPEP_0185901700 /NCGR_PEP_ID=MMETSP0196C-20130402/1041_1 /TAXON_ID=2932 /ORGANISM="Alexandrium fundyense, Strain CCMP1719" /LENGTH=123 /DNA_ID=CAMNT_0028620399 /DNA_START=70 /DNA_END=438 /DNA_ORIENTATION=+